MSHTKADLLGCPFTLTLIFTLIFKCKMFDFGRQPSLEEESTSQKPLCRATCQSCCHAFLSLHQSHQNFSCRMTRGSFSAQVHPPPTSPKTHTQISFTSRWYYAYYCGSSSILLKYKFSNEDGGYG